MDNHSSISPKSIKQLCNELGYELSSNAFALLDRIVKERLGRGDSLKNVNGWLVGVLQAVGGVRDNKDNRRVVKRGDIERMMEIVNVTEAVDETVDGEDVTVNTSDTSCDIPYKVPCDILPDTPSDMSDISADMLFSGYIANTILLDIVQLPSRGQVDEIEELKDEIERLKKIIQIILNKQAELV